MYASIFTEPPTKGFCYQRNGANSRRLFVGPDSPCGLGVSLLSHCVMLRLFPSAFQPLGTDDFCSCCFFFFTPFFCHPDQTWQLEGWVGQNKNFMFDQIVLQVGIYTKVLNLLTCPWEENPQEKPAHTHTHTHRINRSVSINWSLKFPTISAVSLILPHFQLEEAVKAESAPLLPGTHFNSL